MTGAHYAELQCTSHFSFLRGASSCDELFEQAANDTIAEFARRHDVHPNLVHVWRRQAQTGELSVAADGEAHFVAVSVAGESSAAGLIADDAGVGTVVRVGIPWR